MWVTVHHNPLKTCHWLTYPTLNSFSVKSFFLQFNFLTCMTENHGFEGWLYFAEGLRLAQGEHLGQLLYVRNSAIGHMLMVPKCDGRGTRALWSQCPGAYIWWLCIEFWGPSSSTQDHEGCTRNSLHLARDLVQKAADRKKHICMLLCP